MLSQLYKSVVSKVKANCSLILDTIDSISFVLVAIDILVVVQGFQDYIQWSHSLPWTSRRSWHLREPAL